MKGYKGDQNNKLSRITRAMPYQYFNEYKGS